MNSVGVGVGSVVATPQVGKREPPRKPRKPDHDDYIHSYKFKNSIERRFSRSQDSEVSFWVGLYHNEHHGSFSVYLNIVNRENKRKFVHSYCIVFVVFESHLPSKLLKFEIVTIDSVLQFRFKNLVRLDQ